MKNCLRDIREDRKLSRQNLADKIKSSLAQITKLETSERRLSDVWIEKLCTALECTPNDLLGYSTAHSDQNTGASANTEFPHDIMAVPYAAGVAASAGAGAAIQVEKTDKLYYFRKSWIRRYTDSNPDDLIVISVEGDSMEPMLHSGDQVLVDTGVLQPRHDGIYIVRGQFDDLHVKRIQLDSKQAQVIVISDNSFYSSISYSFDEVAIIGKVIWMGRKV